MTGLLLDTHVWIWLMEGKSNLAATHCEMINQAASNSTVSVAAISLWEVMMLSTKGRITLKNSPLTWINESLKLPGMDLSPLTPEVAVDSCQFSNDFHGDPADRLIIATARVNSLTLLTHDEKIISYAKIGPLSVIAV